MKAEWGSAGVGCRLCLRRATTELTVTVAVAHENSLIDDKMARQRD